MQRQRYVIKDARTGNFVDSGSIGIIALDHSGNCEWVYSSYTAPINYITMYPNLEFAERIITGLNKLAELAGLEAEFVAEEFTGHESLKSEGTHRYLPIPKGKKTVCRKLLRDIRKQYIN